MFSTPAVIEGDYFSIAAAVLLCYF